MHESVPIRDVGICIQWGLLNGTEPPRTPPSIPRPLTEKTIRRPYSSDQQLGKLTGPKEGFYI